MEKREILLLISACLLKTINGFSYSGPIYANFMKYSYGLNQRQLELAIAAIYMGTVPIVLSGLFYDRYGVRASIALSGVLSSLATSFLVIGMAHPEPLRRNTWLLYILMFLYGHSFNYSDVAAVACALTSFPPNRRGFVMTMLENCFSLGLPTVSLLYYVIFDNLHRSVADQRPVGTMIVLLLFSFAAHLFSFFFLLPIARNLVEEEPNESTPSIGEQQEQKQSYTTTGASSREENTKETSATQSTTAKSIKDEKNCRQDDGFLDQIRDFLSVCCSSPFLSLLLGIALSIGPYLSIFLNMTSLTRSLSLTPYDIYFFWLPEVSVITFRSVIGLLTDRYLPRVRQLFTFMLVCISTFGGSSVLMLCTPMATGTSPLGVMLAANILKNLAACSVYLLLPVIIVKTQPQYLFGRLYSACLLLGTTLAFPLMLQFGALYDSQAKWTQGIAAKNSSIESTTAEPECFGQSCYIYGGIANAACQFVSIAFLAHYDLTLRLTGE